MTGNTPPDLDGRNYPTRPIVGVAGAVISGTRVLLIRRGKEPMRGAWSLPGGALELGELVVDGVRREIWEEAGIEVRPVELVEALDRISRDSEGRIAHHYVLLDWLCALAPASPSRTEEPLVAGSDASAAVWADIDALEPFQLDQITIRVIRRAAGRAEELGL